MSTSLWSSHLSPNITEIYFFDENSVPLHIISIIGFVPAILMILTYPLVLVCFGLIIMLQMVLSLLMAPFGFKYSMLSIFIDISAEATPPGSWQVNQLVGAARQSSQHSTYENREALEVFEKWLLEII